MHLQRQAVARRRDEASVHGLEPLHAKREMSSVQAFSASPHISHCTVEQSSHLYIPAAHRILRDYESSNTSRKPLGMPAGVK